MATPNNILQNVQTYQMAELAWMLNSFVAINKSNKKFQNFDNLTANLGDTVTFDLAPRATTANGLIITQQSAVQRVQSLICSQAVNSTYAFTSQQYIFNAEVYMERFGKSRTTELGSVIESDILLNVVSSVIVNNPQDPRYGQLLDPASGPYRFFGDGVTPINSFGQLAQALSNFRDYGAAMDETCCILPMTRVPAIVNSGLNQFAMDRNDEMAFSWKLGRFSDCDWYESNLLPVHVSGSVGNAASPSNVLTLISTNDPTGNNITQLTLSGATASDPNAIKNGDLMFSIDGVSGQPDMRYLTFIGHRVSEQPVQIRAVGNAGADGSGHVVVNIFPALSSVPGLNQNLNNALNAGMQLQVLPSHRAGVIMSGNPLYLAMPQLPDQSPFSTVTTTDKDSGASIRHYWGSQLGQNNSVYVYDQIWGSTMVAENTMRLVFPL
jgi:hypothetical protein